MFTEDELLPISALQHFVFCPRQCALIHVERLWAENRLTVEGKQLHERADDASREKRGGANAVRSLPIRSFEYGLSGIADVVEFSNGSALPVEYKRGRPKKDDSDRVQLCAQAFCLEEMLNLTIPLGALFYGKRKRRTEVDFDSKLRDRTKHTIEQLRSMIKSQSTPPAVREAKCESCSLIHLCLPDAADPRRSASRFVQRQWTAHLRAEGPATDHYE